MKTFSLCFLKILVVGALSSGLSVGQIDAPPGNASADFDSQPSEVIPNVELPSHVIAADGQLTLFADYTNIVKSGCPIFLINRTDEVVFIPVQGGGLVLKLTCQTADGVWHRAQSHGYGDEGDIASHIALHPGQHLRTIGFQPQGGQIGKIRYQFYGVLDNLASNVGAGFWVGEDMMISATDKLADLHDPGMQELRSFVMKIHQGSAAERWLAIDVALVRLDLISKWRTGGFFSYDLRQIKESTQKLAIGNPKRAERMFSRIAEIGSRRPPPDTPSGVLRRACVDYIQSSAPASQVNHEQSEYPWIAWNVLNWLISVESQEKSLFTPAWKDIFSLADERIPFASSNEKSEISRLFRFSELVDEHVHTPTLVKYVGSEHLSLSDASIKQLSYRHAFEEMAKLGMEAPPSVKIRILRHFCSVPSAVSHHRVLRTSIDDKNQIQFWESCIKADPWKSVGVMKLATGFTDNLYLEPWLSILLREEFEKLLASAENAPFPVIDEDELGGLRDYVRMTMSDPRLGDLRRLERCIQRLKSAPLDEPEIHASARKTLLYSVGSELRKEEYYR